MSNQRCPRQECFERDEEEDVNEGVYSHWPPSFQPWSLEGKPWRWVQRVVQRVMGPKKGWKPLFEKDDDDGIKRDESCDTNKKRDPW